MVRGRTDWLKVAETAATATRKIDGDACMRGLCPTFGSASDGDRVNPDPSSTDNHVSWHDEARAFVTSTALSAISVEFEHVCLFACIAKDKATARELFERIGKKLDVEVWSNRVIFQARKQWATSADGGESSKPSPRGFCLDRKLLRAVGRISGSRVSLCRSAVRAAQVLLKWTKWQRGPIRRARCGGNQVTIPLLLSADAALSEPAPLTPHCDKIGMAAGRAQPSSG